MNLIENLIQTAGEEAAEVAQALSKVNRFGPESLNPTTNRKAIEDVAWEMNDLLAVFELLKDRGFVIEGVGDPAAVGKAKQKIVEALEISNKAGLLLLPDDAATDDSGSANVGGGDDSGNDDNLNNDDNNDDASGDNAGGGDNSNDDNSGGDEEEQEEEEENNEEEEESEEEEEEENNE